MLSAPMSAISDKNAKTLTSGTADLETVAAPIIQHGDEDAYDDPRVGTVLAGRYELARVLGTGGMATVYAARHLLVDKPCAIKVISPLYARDVVVRERFRREARSAQKLAHPNVIEIFDHGEAEDGTTYIVMEQLEGCSLAELIESGSIPIPRGIGLMIQIARGIARAHDLDVLHRDLKPENIFVCRRADGGDLIKLLDFGIARSLDETPITGTGELFGTPQYMAPERISRSEVGPSADLYSLGVIFYEIATGRLPFEADEVAAFFLKHLREQPKPPSTHRADIPHPLDQLILRLLAKDPKERPVDAHRVQKDLVELAEQRAEPIPVAPAVDPSSSRRAAHARLPRPPTEWRTRTASLERLLDRVYGTDWPVDARAKLSEIRQRVERVGELSRRRIRAENQLEELLESGREGRQRFGFAVDALGVDASRARDDEREAEERFKHAEHQAEAAQALYRKSLDEISLWEGRSGMREPYEELSIAYRAAADALDTWRIARANATRAQQDLDRARKAASDLNYQISELRSALAAHEQRLFSEQDATELTITALSAEANRLEREAAVLVRALVEPITGEVEAQGILAEVGLVRAKGDSQPPRAGKADPGKDGEARSRREPADPPGSA